MDLMLTLDYLAQVIIYIIVTVSACSAMLRDTLVCMKTGKSQAFIQPDSGRDGFYGQSQQ
jgi:hypothetical protein